MSFLILELQSAIEKAHVALSEAGVPTSTQENAPMSLHERVTMVTKHVEELRKNHVNSASTIDLLRDVIAYNGFDLESELKEAVERREAEEKSGK